jgi:pimeloyl-ACP methyl ester carboxylesterase
VTESKPEIYGFEVRAFDERATRLRYLVGGEGPPLLLVHGFAGAASNFAVLAPLLARRRRVIVPELPGHGGSAPLHAAPNLAVYADRVAAVAAREGVDSAAVLGHSLGGVVALRLAVRRPELVRALVLASAAGISTASRVAQVFLETASLLKPGRRIAAFRSRIARSPRLRALAFDGLSTSDGAALSEEATLGFLSGSRRYTDIASAGRALAREDVRLDLERVTCPTLVLWGARDKQVAIDDGFEYARRLRAPLRVIADCGHLLVGERPDACADAVERFLDGLDGR